MPQRPRKTGEITNPLDELRRLKPRTAPVFESPPDRTAGETESQRFRDLLDVAVSLTSTLELKAILNAIVDGIIRVTSCERGFVILRESDGTFAMYTGRSREGAPWDENSAREISHTVVARVVETHETFIGLDLSAIDELRGQKSILAQRIRSAVCLPLIDQDQLIGVIYADSSFPIPAFGETDRAVLSAFGSQAAVAIGRARQHGDIIDRGERLEEQNRQLRQQLSQHVNVSGMITRNKAILEVFSIVERIAPTDISVLIRGESGTGKDLLARAIHEKSPRHNRPYIAVNCTTMPLTLVESILFGHRRGAFTGADADKEGLFELANGGTLFLDEIGEMPLAMQPKLLRALQEREITRMSEENRVRKVDVRVITATNRDLPRAVKDGSFREDLFYRLNGAPLFLPPLRERREDIIPLAEYFLAGFAAKQNQPAPKLARDARAFLLGHAWPGNVRELQNMMAWAITFQEENGIVNADALERWVRSNSSLLASPAAETDSGAGSLRQLVDRFEERTVREALTRNDNNVSATAKALGLSRQMLHEKIRKYGIATRDG